MRTVNSQHSCGAMILAISILAAGSIAQTPSGRAAEKRQWQMPLAAETHVGLHVADKGRLAFLVSRSAGAKSKTASVCHVFDTKTGKVRDLTAEAADKIGAGRVPCDTFLPSGDGKYLLLAHGGRAVSDKHRTAHLLTLATGEVHKLAQTADSALRAAWADGKLYLSQMRLRGGDVLDPIRVFDPAKGTQTDLKVYGVVSAADARRQVVVCLCNPTAPTRPMKLNRITAQLAGLAVVTHEGKVATQLCARRDFWGQAALSPAGRFVACMQVQVRLLGQRPTTIIQVWDITGGQRRTIPENETLLAVTDTGQVVTQRRPTTIKLWDTKGKARILAQDARTAAVDGETLFYTTGKEKLVLHTTPLGAKPQAFTAASCCCGE